jgi:hypothetical protein
MSRGISLYLAVFLEEVDNLTVLRVGDVVLVDEFPKVPYQIRRHFAHSSIAHQIRHVVHCGAPFSWIFGVETQ